MANIDVRTAVNNAIVYLKSIQDLIGNAATEIEDLRLEEIELSEDKKSWLITLGFDIPVKNRSPIEAIMASPIASPKYQREYRLFQVNAETGEVESMKIRKV